MIHTNSTLITQKEFKKWGILISDIVWGLPKPDIANKFDVKLPYIYQVLKKFQEQGNFDDEKKSNGGQNKKMNQEILALIIEETETNRFVSANELSQVLKQELDIELSTTSINNTHLELGFYYDKIQANHQLSKSTQEKRLSYCKIHKNDSFNNVLFKDIQKQYQNLPNPNYKIMIWGGICTKGRTKLKIIRLEKKETMNSDYYIEILKNTCINQMNDWYGEPNRRLMQDNARCHISAQTQNFLRDQNIEFLDHPPYSPDLNPIERVWAWMKQDVGKAVYKNVNELIEAVEQSWNRFSDYLIIKNIEHHKNLIKLVRKSKGKFID